MTRWSLLLALSGLAGTGAAMSGAARAQQAPFTIAAPAADSRSFSFDDSAAPPRATTIVPRLTGPDRKPESLHDGATGARTEEFGGAYSYANPLYGTNHLGNDGVGLPSGGAGEQAATVSFVVARFGAPPPKLPPIAGVDPSTSRPDVALIRYAMHVDGAAFPDPGSADVIDLAMHDMGRARVTQLDIAAATPPDPAARDALLRLVALALVHQGVHPAAILSGGRRVLPRGDAERGGAVPGHVFSLVLSGGS